MANKLIETDDDYDYEVGSSQTKAEQLAKNQFEDKLDLVEMPEPVGLEEAVKSICALLAEAGIYLVVNAQIKPLIAILQAYGESLKPQWQDISTAPKGPRLLLKNSDGIYCGRWITEREIEEDFEDEYDNLGEGWYEENFYHEYYDKYCFRGPFPTHWMPLPAPPAIEGGV
jgi:hypothetical protein